MLRSWILGLAAAFATTLCVAASTAEDDAVQTAQKAIDSITSILKDEQLGYAAKRKQVDEVLRERVDQVILARLVLARNWKKLDEKQQEEFVTVFMDHLVLTYWDTLIESKISAVKITSDREEKRGDWTVKTRVDLDQGREPVLIDYRLRREKLESGEPGRWLFIDIIIEGVSLVSNFRSQLAEVFANGGAQHLIDAIKKKNKSLNERLEKKHGK